MRDTQHVDVTVLVSKILYQLNKIQSTLNDLLLCLPEAPEIMIYPRDDVVTEEENTLICFINHFYPPTINIKWTKNDEEIMVEDAFYKCTPNSDGTFYVFSTLSFVPKQGDIYSCTVEHESLKGPQTKFWGESKEA